MKESQNPEIRRLVLAKKLYLHGCNHASKRDQVSRMLAIHHFDNAVEIVLKCVITKYRVVSSSKQEYRFKELWSNIVKQGVNLPLKDQMFALHDLRNLVQHQRDIPSNEDAIKYKGYVEEFFKKVCEEIFAILFEQLCLSLLIENAKLKREILKVERDFEKGEYKQCIELCEDAIIYATFDHADIFHKAGILTGYWGASEELKKVINKDYPEKYKDKEFYELAKDLSRATVQLGQAATGMQFLGECRMDFMKHRKIIESLEDLPENQLKDCAAFCLNFVIDLILKWQEEGIFISNQ